MRAIETVEVDTHHVSCDGGKGSLGHPKIYLTIPEETGQAICRYCEKHFIYRHSHDVVDEDAEKKKLAKKKKA